MVSPSLESQGISMEGIIIGGGGSGSTVTASTALPSEHQVGRDMVGPRDLVWMCLVHVRIPDLDVCKETMAGDRLV